MKDKKVLIVVDFDWTVFDLRILTEAMEKALDAFGLKPDLFKQTFEHAKDNPEGYYDRETHISAILKAQGQHDEGHREAIMSTWKDLTRILSASAFDPLEFQAFKTALSGIEVVILTYGEQTFQQSKLDASGVSALVEHTYITSVIGGKEQHLRSWLDEYEQVVSINDAVEPNDSFLTTFRSEVDAGRLLILEMQREYKNSAKQRHTVVEGIVPVTDLGERTVEVILKWIR